MPLSERVAVSSKEIANERAPKNRRPKYEVFQNSLLPLRFAGMGLFIAWLCCTHVVNIFPGNHNHPALRDVFDIGMRCGDIATFLVLALASSKIGALSLRLRTNAALVALTAAGTALIGLWLIPIQAPEVIVAATSFLTAIGGAILLCLWAETYCQLGTMQTVVYGSMSGIAGAIVSFIIKTMTEPFAIIAVSFLPVASFVCVTLSFRIISAEQKKPSDVRFPIPWKLIALMAFAGLATGLAGSLLESEEGIGAIHRVVATGLVGVALLILVFARKNQCDVRFLAQAALPVSIIAFALMPLAGPMWAHAVSFLIMLAYVCFTLFVLLLLASIAYRFQVPSLRLFAFTRATSESALLIGVSTRRWIQQTELLSSDTFLFAIAIAGIIMVFVCVLIWMKEQSVNADWGASGISLKDSVHIPSPREQIIMRCEQLCEIHGLTARETEILGLLAQRKSRIEIEQQLFLSQNTIKTHTRHLYAKLGVHSKDEVYRLFIR